MSTPQENSSLRSIHDLETEVDALLLSAKSTKDLVAGEKLRSELEAEETRRETALRRETETVLKQARRDMELRMAECESKAKSEVAAAMAERDAALAQARQQDRRIHETMLDDVRKSAAVRIAALESEIKAERHRRDLMVKEVQKLANDRVRQVEDECRAEKDRAIRVLRSEKDNAEVHAKRQQEALRLLVEEAEKLKATLLEVHQRARRAEARCKTAADDARREVEFQKDSNLRELRELRSERQEYASAAAIAAENARRACDALAAVREELQRERHDHEKLKVSFENQVSRQASEYRAEVRGLSLKLADAQTAATTAAMRMDAAEAATSSAVKRAADAEEAMEMRRHSLDSQVRRFQARETKLRAELDAAKQRSDDAEATLQKNELRYARDLEEAELTIQKDTEKRVTDAVKKAEQKVRDAEDRALDLEAQLEDAVKKAEKSQSLQDEVKILRVSVDEVQAKYDTDVEKLERKLDNVSKARDDAKSQVVEARARADEERTKARTLIQRQRDLDTKELELQQKEENMSRLKNASSPIGGRRASRTTFWLGLDDEELTPLNFSELPLTAEERRHHQTRRRSSSGE